MSIQMNGKPIFKKVLKAVRELDPARNVKYKKKDDIATAELFADIFASVARYNVNSRTYYVYDGVKWQSDIEGMKVEHFAKLLSRALLTYAVDVGDESYSHFVAKLQDRRKRETMIRDARDFYPVQMTDFDSDPYLFNCKNCVINLKTCERLEHDSSLLLSKVSGVVYDPEATCDEFNSFLDDVLVGDAGKREYLQKIIGYSMIGLNIHEELYMIYGSTTRNGKSTMLDTLNYVFGDYGANIMPETLAQQKEKNSRQASGDIARLNGVRFLHCGEPPKRMKFDVALVKALTGNDLITARHLNEREFQFRPVFTLFINTNYLPLVSDDTLFSSGRVKVISFDRHFEPEEQDETLKPRLRREENISGIFNWMLEGLRMYYADGGTLRLPESVKKTTEEYRQNSDKIQCFIQDCLLPAEGNCMTAKFLYEQYASWCKGNGFGVENKSNFLDELRGKGLLSKTGTIAGTTFHNVVKNYTFDASAISWNNEEGYITN